MHAVGSRLGDPVDYAVRCPAILGGVSRALDFELLHTLHAHAVHGRIVAALAVGFGAIQLFALAVEQAAANARIIGRPNHSGCQNNEGQIAADTAAADE